MESFFETCKQHTCDVFIISHKTEYASQDETHTNLRVAALEWMTSHRFFDPDGFGLSDAEVFFEDSRHNKLERIRRLGCTHVVDDLEETFTESSFPTDVTKILYSPEGPTSSQPDIQTARNWQQVTDYIFDTLRQGSE